MNCADIDLKAYALNELASHERRTVEVHAAGCPACAAELAHLEMTGVALLSWRDEEMPRRIAFVAGPESSPSWWTGILGRGPAMAFASACVLAVGIFSHGVLTRPSPTVVGAPAVSTEEIVRQVEARTSQSIDQAVRRAVATSQQAQAQRTAQLLAAADERRTAEQQALAAAMQVNYDLLLKKYNQLRKETQFQSASLGGAQ